MKGVTDVTYGANRVTRAPRTAKNWKICSLERESERLPLADPSCSQWALGQISLFTNGPYNLHNGPRWAHDT